MTPTSSLHKDSRPLKYKNLMINVLKMSFVGSILYWLAASGRLDFNQLKILLKNPTILVANIALWLFAYLILGAFRWYLLLRGQGLILNFLQVIRLQLIGFFFNTAIPGAVGGDIIKAVYVIKGLQSDRKTPAMLTILLDRIMGLAALFYIGAFSILMSLDFFLSQPVLLPLVIFVLVGTIASMLGICWVLFINDKYDFIARLTKKKFPGVNTLAGIYNAIKVYRAKPIVILQTLLIGITIQGLAVSYGLFLTQSLTGLTPNPLKFCAVYAVAVMTTALPLAPGGLGVGHVAFEKLLLLINVPGGANIFNVMVLVQLILNLLGFIPYLNFKSQNLQGSDQAVSLDITPKSSY